MMLLAIEVIRFTVSFGAETAPLIVNSGGGIPCRSERIA